LPLLKPSCFVIQFTSGAPERGNLARATLTEGAILRAIFDFLYREYCRSRLVEMRKQLLLVHPKSVKSPHRIATSEALTTLMIGVVA
jgi:hypothetical protein